MSAPPRSLPVLSDGELTLRAPAEADRARIVEMCRDPEMVRWTQVPRPYAEADAAEYLAGLRPSSATSLTWALDAGDGFAGNLDLRFAPFGNAEIGFAVHPAYRGRGLMTRAVALVVEHAFAEEGVRCLVWTAGVGNWASRRVAWRCGFRFGGRLRGHWANPERRADRWQATLLPDDRREPPLPWWDPPRLVGTRVVLRPGTDDDAERMAEACADPRTQRWLGDLPPSYDVDDALAHLEEVRESHSTGGSMTWTLADPVTDELLGEVSLMHARLSATSGAEIGYWAHPDARGRGVMTEAVRLVTRWAFDPSSGLDLLRITLRASAGNTASQHVAEAAGFSVVGRQRRAESLRDGTVEDLVEFDLLAEDLSVERLGG